MDDALLGAGAMVLTGVMWSGTGTIMALAAARRRDALGLMAVSAPIAVGLSLVGLVRYGAFAGDLPPRYAAAMGLIAAAGAIGAIGTRLLMGAMARGNQAAAWTIGQAALIWPYLAGMLLWREPHRWLQNLGVAGILAGLIAIGFGRSREDTAAGRRAGRTGLMLALGAFCCWGLQQVLTTVPSTWTGWSDPTRCRPLAFYSGYGVACWLLVLVRRRGPAAGIWRYSLPLAVIGVVSMLVFFIGIDALGRTGRSSLGFPLAVACCIAGFALVSVTALRERPRPLLLAGISVVVAGAVLLAM
jgi:drug/metabolite transporter (DMT)-like permease